MFELYDVRSGEVVSRHMTLENAMIARVSFYKMRRGTGSNRVRLDILDNGERLDIMRWKEVEQELMAQGVFENC